MQASEQPQPSQAQQASTHFLFLLEERVHTYIHSYCRYVLYMHVDVGTRDTNIEHRVGRRRVCSVCELTLS